MKKSSIRNRVQQIGHDEAKNAAPRTVSTQNIKNFSLSAKNAEIYHHRITKMEDLQLELLREGLYNVITPVNIFTGEFQVMNGFEGRLVELANEYGFCASEVIEL